MEFTQCHDPRSVVWQDVTDALPSSQHTPPAENLPPLPLHTGTSQQIRSLNNVGTRWAGPYKDPSSCLAPKHTYLTLFSRGSASIVPHSGLALPHLWRLKLGKELILSADLSGPGSTVPERRFPWGLHVKVSVRKECALETRLLPALTKSSAQRATQGHMI